MLRVNATRVIFKTITNPADNGLKLMLMLMMPKTCKMTETLANGYSSKSTQQELFNGYQHDRV